MSSTYCKMFVEFWVILLCPTAELGWENIAIPLWNSIWKSTTYFPFNWIIPCRKTAQNKDPYDWSVPHGKRLSISQTFRNKNFENKGQILVDMFLMGKGFTSHKHSGTTKDNFQWACSSWEKTLHPGTEKENSSRRVTFQVTILKRNTSHIYIPSHHLKKENSKYYRYITFQVAIWKRKTLADTLHSRSLFEKENSSRYISSCSHKTATT